MLHVLAPLGAELSQEIGLRSARLCQGMPHQVEQHAIRLPQSDSCQSKNTLTGRLGDLPEGGALRGARQYRGPAQFRPGREP